MLISRGWKMIRSHKKDAEILNLDYHTATNKRVVASAFTIFEP